MGAACAAAVAHVSSWPVAPRPRWAPPPSVTTCCSSQAHLPNTCSSQQLRALVFTWWAFPLQAVSTFILGLSACVARVSGPQRFRHKSTCGAPHAALVSKEPGCWECGKQR